MGYATGQPIVWPARPDWSQPVRETLAWLTDSLRAVTGPEQARALRGSPRRGFSFRSELMGDERRWADAIRFDVGIGRIQLPIYPDIQLLSATLASGSISIPCATDGYDFVAGGNALLWSAINSWEIVAIDTVASDQLTLSAATASDWAAGTRLYPLRAARLLSAPQATRETDEVTTLDISVAIDEPCTWAAAWPTATTYRGEHVLEWRGDESTAPTGEYDRRAITIDDTIGTPYYADLPAMPFGSQVEHFSLNGRDDHTAFRSLLYQLDGSAGRLWVPSWVADLRLTQAIDSGDDTITVGNAGYGIFGREQVNRRDLAIELLDGTRYYRRVTASTVADDTETLTLDAAIDADIDLSRVRQIGWLSLCALATDTVTIEHQTDAFGLAACDLQFEALSNDV